MLILSIKGIFLVPVSSNFAASVYNILKMWWLIGSAPYYWSRSPGFNFGISHNDTGALQDHCGIGWSDFFWSDRRRYLTKGQA